MKNKILSILLVTAMVSTLVVGCGNKTNNGGANNAGDNNAAATEQDNTKDEPAAEETKNAVTLKTVSMFGGTDPHTSTYQDINTQLMADNSYITIEDNSQTSDEDWKNAMAADFAAGNEPDVFQYFTDANAATILEADKFVSIDEIRAEYPEYASDIFDDALSASANPDGVCRAVPTTGYWEGLFCNKDLFDEYNVELPTDWDSLVTAIETFKENNIIPIAVSLNNVPHYWLEFQLLYTAGADEYATIPETAPESWVKGLEVFKTLRDMGAFPVDTDTVDNDSVGVLFRDKKAAMQLDGSWYAGQIEDAENTVVVAFPGVPEQKADKGAVISGFSTGFYITKKAWEDPDKRDAAVKFVMAHTSKDSIQKYWEAGGAMSKAAANVTPITEGLSALAISAGELTSAAPTISLPTDARIGSAAYGVLIANCVKISTGAVSAEDVINEALQTYRDAQ